MLRTGWSWPELMALPAHYLPVLIEVINEEERDAAGAAAMRGLMGRR